MTPHPNSILAGRRGKAQCPQGFPATALGPGRRRLETVRWLEGEALRAHTKIDPDRRQLVFDAKLPRSGGRWISSAMSMPHPASPPPVVPEEERRITAQLLQTLAPCCDYDGMKLADRLNISLRHLHRIFAAIFAQTPRDWLNEQRLVRAKQMLLTAGSVKEVAFTLRFRAASQFSRDFRRQFGLIPSSLLGQREELAESRSSVGTRQCEPRSPDKNRPRVCSAA